MTLKAQEYSKRAAFYEKAVDDESLPREQSILFAKKANWLHVLSRITEKQEQAAARSFRRDAIPVSMRPVARPGGKLGRSLAAVCRILTERLTGRQRPRPAKTGKAELKPQRIRYTSP
jgi:hypothetical protein